MAEESERIENIEAMAAEALQALDRDRLLGVVKILLVVGAEQRGQIEQLQKQARMSGISVHELHETVERMERRLRSRDDRLSRTLMAAYDALVPRFADDLKNEKDELLSRGGALMLIQQLLLSTLDGNALLKRNANSEQR
jgi:hypothetical protein